MLAVGAGHALEECVNGGFAGFLGRLGFMSWTTFSVRFLFGFCHRRIGRSSGGSTAQKQAYFASETARACASPHSRTPRPRAPPAIDGQQHGYAEVNQPAGIEVPFSARLRDVGGLLGGRGQAKAPTASCFTQRRRRTALLLLVTSASVGKGHRGVDK